MAHVTTRIPFWTSIQPIYHSHPAEVAVTAGHLFEVSGGRFRLGLGVSHEPAMSRLGLSTGKPLTDMRDYVAGVRGAERAAGALPPIWLATLRDRMLDLALEVGGRGDLGQRLPIAHPDPGGADPARAARVVPAAQHGADGDRRRS